MPSLKSFDAASCPRATVNEQNKHSEPNKNHFTTFTLLAIEAVLKEIYYGTVIFRVSEVKGSAAQEPREERESDADQNAGRDGKIDVQVALLVRDVARQPA